MAQNSLKPSPAVKPLAAPSPNPQPPLSFLEPAHPSCSSAVAGVARPFKSGLQPSPLPPTRTAASSPFPPHLNWRCPPIPLPSAQDVCPFPPAAAPASSALPPARPPAPDAGQT